MKKVIFILILIVVVLGILPQSINIIGPSKISILRTDIHPYRNVVANGVIEMVEHSPYLLPSQPIPSEDKQIVELAHRLTQNKETNLEKSEAIFTWVSQQITYDVKSFYKGDFSHHPTAVEVLNSRKAMCMGYARLNAALHRSVGMEAKVVYGEKHAWNEIYIDGAWHTQDPTYASGYVNETTQTFINEYNPTYFSKTDYQKEGDYNW